MPKFLISFHVEQLLSGTIEVDAPSARAACEGFYRGDFDDARLITKLALEDSEDAIVEIHQSHA
jgi:hypothetical protein